MEGIESCRGSFGTLILNRRGRSNMPIRFEREVDESIYIPTSL